MKYLKFIIFLIFVTSCTTVKDNYVKDNDNFTFTNNLLPGMEIKGITAKEDQGLILYITSVKLFSNWSNGWTEGFFEASGKYLLEKYKDTYKLLEIDPFELWDITSGEIRYHDTYYRGDDGLWKVKNRVDRLKEISRILIDDFHMANTVGNLEDDIKPFLFPELYNFDSMEDKGILHSAFYDSELLKETKKGSGIDWRLDYTESIFPENIWDLRDSGTLYRDIQEAPDIFRAIYNLKYYFRNGEIII